MAQRKRRQDIFGIAEKRGGTKVLRAVFAIVIFTWSSSISRHPVSSASIGSFAVGFSEMEEAFGRFGQGAKAQNALRADLRLAGGLTNRSGEVWVCAGLAWGRLGHRGERQGERERVCVNPKLASFFVSYVLFPRYSSPMILPSSWRYEVSMNTM